MLRRTPTFIFVASLLAVIAVTVGFVIYSGSDEVGDVAAIEAALTSPALPTTTSLPESATTLPASPATTEPDSPPIPVRPGVPLEPPATASPVPVALRVDAIDIDAPVIATGVNQQTGQMAVPNNVRDVAWYKFGSRPGEVGSAVLAAHVDLASQGPGVFFDLRDLNPGDTVEVEFSDGAVTFFRVEARTVYQKDELPLDKVFARQGASVLTLITCGGGFSESSGSYDSNVVVYAVPILERDVESAR
jgi:LPXTG-site transpeptidase (sortase) family protein